MKELAELAIEIAESRGAVAADVRILSQEDEVIEMRNQVPVNLTSRESEGFGISVFYQGGWGFASCRKLSRGRIEGTVSQALDIAAASGTTKRGELLRAEEPVHNASWALPIHHDPFAVPLEDKLALLDQIHRACASVEGVKTVFSNMAFQRREQYFANLEGSRIQQTNFLSGVGFSVIATDGHDMQIRSFPNSFGGQWAAMGYELIYQWPLLENAQRIAEEAVQLLRAPECASQTGDLILDGSQLALQIHESCGHPAELDRVLGYEANFAGTSFLSKEVCGKLQYGSPIVNIYADARPAKTSGAGTYAFDDEGVEAQRAELVEGGRFVGYLQSRETAAAIGAERSNGCVRASGWNRLPIIRMSNICLEPGEWELENLIADTRNGVYMQTNRSWSIDDRRDNFQFGTEIAWEIKNGKLGRILKNPTYGGNTTAFWNSCDAICGAKDWELWGLPNCGKGQPEQIIAASHGAAPARFRNVQLGVKRA